MLLTCNASTYVCGLCTSSATLPEGSAGHETAFSTDLGTDPKFDGLFLARLFALLLHIYAFVYI